MKKPSTDSTFEIVQEQTTAYDSLGGTRSEKRGYLKISNAFRDNLLRELKGPRLSVLLCLALYAGADGEAWPSLATIARDTGYSKSTVVNALDSQQLPSRNSSELLPGLVQLGYVEKERRNKQDTAAYTSTLYRLRIPALSQNASVDGWDYTSPDTEHNKRGSCTTQQGLLHDATRVVAPRNKGVVAPRNLKNYQSFKDNQYELPVEDNQQALAEIFEQFEKSVIRDDGLVVDDDYFSLLFFVMKWMGITEKRQNEILKATQHNRDIAGSVVLYTLQELLAGKVKDPGGYALKFSQGKWDVQFDEDISAAWIKYKLAFLECAETGMSIWDRQDRFICEDDRYFDPLG